uniref:Uncharacterized protein n=1 Tax=viral metagenome TaxID=1070528 RepID=A0A6C0JWM5_9ZZZZ
MTDLRRFGGPINTNKPSATTIVLQKNNYKIEK